MSVINQMLQDLDARRSEVTGTDVYGHNIRAVPERRRVHAAWWVALALGVVLAGVVAGVMLRPAPAPAPVAAPIQPITTAGLPLKLDVDIERYRSWAPPVEQESTVASDQGRDGPVPETPGTGQASAPADAPTVAVKPLLPKAPAPKPTVQATAAMPAPEKPIVVPTAAVPAASHKHVKELTPQQRAENEYRKALFLVQQGKAADAASGFEQALQMDPQHPAARQALVGVFLETGRRDDAVRVAREGLNIDPAQPGLAMILARLRLETGELKSAVETLQRTLPYAADRADYQSFLAALLQRDGRNKEAAEHYLQALQKSPQNGVWWMGLGISLQAENRLVEAQEAFNRAKTSNALSPELLSFVESRLKQLQR
ncbi:MAG: biosis protein MshN [Burkholderiales bacterium]